MGVVDDAIARRKKCIADGNEILPGDYNGVTIEKIKNVLTKIDRCTQNMIEGVFALMSTEPNWFNKAAKNGYQFRDGATTAHIGTHVGILQRGNRDKLDREGRDYWLKPLWEIGAIEKVYFNSKDSLFISGHPKAKSPNSAYRLSDEFISILEAKDGLWQEMAESWIQEDVLRERLKLQAEQAEEAKKSVESAHTVLIKASHQVYAKRFLRGYEVVYIDDGDGDRVTEDQKVILSKAGLLLKLGDAMPDVLLWNPDTDHLWVIEAVTSDGEVDNHKKVSLIEFAERNKKAGVGFTTTYPTWKKAAERQSQLKNLADDTYMWIQEDPSRNLHIKQ
ncbi:BsuBI/PstI family type II restriction endonuclease [Thalassotalea euphylliae]|uniref:BsuBI/PstI family type II restriction endonuclease n=1 Tax=Thalassotalea euphylliae TaxID=1655234 RepID=UPI003627D57B